VFARTYRRADGRPITAVRQDIRTQVGTAESP
jgi:hypothetical protein